MGAPSDIKWGGTVGDYGKIGIYPKLSSTNTTTTVTVEIWFASKYSVSDTNNTLYYDALKTSGGSASSSKGSLSIKTTVASGSEWPSSNEVKLKTFTHTYDRKKEAYTIYLHAKLTNVDRVGGTMLDNKSISIPALATYKVVYNANGGEDAPSSQTKTYGATLKLSTDKPTRAGYSFQGWATSSGGSVVYASGASYTANAAVTLYAVWKANTYKVTYNANGGTGAPAAQTKTYGVTLKLSTTKPTRANYTFKGWATSSSGSVVYPSGYTYTDNKAVTLFAVWELSYIKPRITGLSVSRCDSSGTPTDDGTYALVKFNWDCDKLLTGIDIQYEQDGSGQSVTVSFKPSETLTSDGKYGRLHKTIGDGIISTDSTYIITITVNDESGSTTTYKTIPSASFIIDIKAEGKGIAFGKAAEFEDTLDSGFKIKPSGGFVNIPLEENTNLNDVIKPNTYVSQDKVASTYINCPISGGTFTLEVTSAGNEGQVKQKAIFTSKNEFTEWIRFYHSGSWGEWHLVYAFKGRLLASPGQYMTEGHVANLSSPVSEQPNGIVLVFSVYSDGAPQNYQFNSFFVSKYIVAAHSGSGHTFFMSASNFAYACSKYLYISDTKITGYVDNNKTGTGSNGITYDNKRYVLRYVIGV